MYDQISFKLLFHSQAARRGRRSSASSQRATDLCGHARIELAPPAASFDLDAEEVLVVGVGLFEQLEALGLDVDALLDNVVSRDHQILGPTSLTTTFVLSEEPFLTRASLNSGSDTS